MACAGNPSHCKTVASFDNIRCTRAPVLELPPLCLDLLKTALCDSLLLNSEYSESSRDSRVQSEIPN